MARYGIPGYTPLHSGASSNANPATIEALIDAGADVSARTDYRRNDSHRAAGTKPLHGAARFNRNPVLIDALLSAGADPNARSDSG